MRGGSMDPEIDERLLHGQDAEAEASGAEETLSLADEVLGSIGSASTSSTASTPPSSPQQPLQTPAVLAIKTAAKPELVRRCSVRDITGRSADNDRSGLLLGVADQQRYEYGGSEQEDEEENKHSGRPLCRSGPHTSRVSTISREAFGEMGSFILRGFFGGALRQIVW